MQEHHITVPRTARYYTLGDAYAGVREVWFVCHGFSQLAGRFLRHFSAIDDGARLIVAPEALNRFYLDPPSVPTPDRRVGATWMTREDRVTEISDYISYLDTLYDYILEELPRDTVQVNTLGFSQGVATVSRWAVFGRARFDRLILWAGGVPADLDLRQHADRLRETRLLLVVGDQDEFIKPEHIEEQEKRLKDYDIPYEMVRFSGGHAVTADGLKAFLGAV
ncbi:MAG: dienelactone hydrolase family protein [Anaerolineae bacterium]|nr:dienelactone hydrolase family protein [Gemmatimonadaceae bacterium]